MTHEEHIRPGSPLQARISGLAYGGEMVGTIETPELRGKKIFVRGTIPGELVQISGLTEKESFARASLDSILDVSPYRVTAPCPYFGDCGGCDLQHIELKAQREFKRQMVESMLDRQAKVTPQQGVKIAGEDLPGYHYRSRLALHLGEDGTLGLFRLGSNNVVDINYCYLAYASLNTGLAALKQALRPFGRLFRSILLEEWEGRPFAILKTREVVHDQRGLDNAAAELSPRVLSFAIQNGPAIVFAQLDGVRISAVDQALGHFSQVNRESNLVLQSLVSALVTHPEVTDLYAGSGNLSFPLTKKQKRVIAVERDPVLVEAGRRQAEGLRVSDRIDFMESSCERYARENQLTPSVVLDPPRSGAKEAVKYFSSELTKEVVYVSCNLPSFCRDVRALCDRGFRLEIVHVLDMFPQSHHVEMIGRLTA